MYEFKYMTGEQVRVRGSKTYNTIHLDGKQGTVISSGFFSCDIEIDGEVHRIMNPYIEKAGA